MGKTRNSHVEAWIGGKAASREQAEEKLQGGKLTRTMGACARTCPAIRERREAHTIGRGMHAQEERVQQAWRRPTIGARDAMAT